MPLVGYSPNFIYLARSTNSIGPPHASTQPKPRWYRDGPSHDEGR